MKIMNQIHLPKRLSIEILRASDNSIDKKTNRVPVQRKVPRRTEAEVVVEKKVQADGNM